MRVFNDQGHYKVRFSPRAQAIALAGFLGMCLAVAIAGSGMVLGDVHIWYCSLTAPPFSPSDRVFGPVALVLYVAVAVAGWLVGRRPDVRWRHHKALMFWGWQLALTAIWTPLFFGLHLILLALAVAIILFGAIAATMIRFRSLSRAAAMLMLPSLCWVGFASYLNAGFWWLNH